jgi:hypothetical protein
MKEPLSMKRLIILASLLLVITVTYTFAETQVATCSQCKLSIETLVSKSLSSKKTNQIEKHQTIWQILKILDTYKINTNFRINTLEQIKKITLKDPYLRRSFEFYTKKTSFSEIDNFLFIHNSNIIKQVRDLNFNKIKLAYRAKEKRNFTLRNIKMLMKQPIEISVSHDPQSEVFLKQLNKFRGYAEQIYNRSEKDFIITKSEFVSLCFDFFDQANFISSKNILSKEGKDSLTPYFVTKIQENAKNTIQQRITKEIIEIENPNQQTFNSQRIKALKH